MVPDYSACKPACAKPRDDPGDEIVFRITCNSNYLQFYGFYLLIKGSWLLNCRYRSHRVEALGFRVTCLREAA